METLTVVVELELTVLGKVTDEDRAEVLGLIAKQAYPVPVLPYGMTARLKSVSFGGNAGVAPAL